MDNLRNVIHQAKENADARDGDVKKKAEARLYMELSVIAQEISTADAAGKREVLIQGGMSDVARATLAKEGCKVQREERGINPSTHDAMFVGWRVSW
jgi:2-iminoacetate synthase ThiH